MKLRIVITDANILKINHRLPQKEIDKRLKEWGSKLKNE